MLTLRRHRWALIAVVLAVSACILSAALTSPFGHFEAAVLLPVFLYDVAAVFITHRRVSHQSRLYICGPFASDITFRGPPTF